MSLIGILILLIIIGALVYLVHSVIPMDPKIRIIFDVVLVIAICLWLLNNFGFTAGYHGGWLR